MSMPQVFGQRTPSPGVSSDTTPSTVATAAVSRDEEERLESSRQKSPTRAVLVHSMACLLTC